MPVGQERTFSAYIGLAIFDTTGGKCEQFINVGTRFDGLKDAHRQAMQDALIEYQGELQEALEPFNQMLNELGSLMMGENPNYEAASEAVDHLEIDRESLSKEQKQAEREARKKRRRANRENRRKSR